MDPIHPIAPGGPFIPRSGLVPVERLERVSRERDRPSHERDGRKRRERAEDGGPEDPPEGEHGHIDVRV